MKRFYKRRTPYWNILTLAWNHASKDHKHCSVTCQHGANPSRRRKPWFAAHADASANASGSDPRTEGAAQTERPPPMCCCSQRN
mmetsp:Transcript_26779/g.46455  ORF Transcript_26779/g.46455 Transcript_26779/m.46455 type:complete len:84 (+) Transcript_26779:1663-1914(+)